ncbi:LuxR C-terminal-related transcriptional regulator [Jiulongibacter sp. NS-SX5]|uniref:LuxR C-terminal-related transcriptional regulator n=1 Tax=Jiulongibacter sp. NS-SX5 TaxID=3463854 RepID=UPI0040583F75
MQITISHKSTFFCQLLRESLHSRNFDVASYATSGDLSWKQISVVKPDIAIVAFPLENMTGVELVRKIREVGNGTKILFMSQDSLEAKEVDNGLDVEGHVMSTDSMSQFFFALHEIAGGRKYVSPNVEKLLASTITSENSRLDTSVLELLTPREREIMRALSDSCTTPEIAEKFTISKATVNNHRANIMNKLKLKGRNQLLSLAVSLKPYYSISA